MKESIYTIPVSEVLEPRDGCPLCRMQDTLEKRTVEYIMGAAMMEPDVRQETNRKGFCFNHYNMMLSQRNRLSLALMLQSRLAELLDQDLSIQPARAPLIERLKRGTPSQEEDCYICGKIQWAMSRMIGNLMRMYSGREEVRRLFEQQPKLCYTHYKLLMEQAEGVEKKYRKQFSDTAKRLVKTEMEMLFQDVSHFCNMFDYRNSDLKADWGNSRDSIERTIGFLTGRTEFVEKSKKTN